MNFKKIAAGFLTAVTVIALPLNPVCAVQTDNQILDKTLSFYDYWKETYISQDTYVPGEPQYYVRYSDEKYSGNNQSVEVTVSEAHGYGMLITACLADYDDNTKELFDGMYRYYKAHLSDIGPNLMSWQQCDNGTALIDGAYDGSMYAGESDSAADGDLDIAYALLIADYVWGSNGDINYKQTAINIINDIMKYEVNKTDWIIQLGDWCWWSEPGETYYSATRSSDFIMQYMPVFAEVTGDQRWINVYDSTYDIINNIIAEYDTGLLPDFIVKDSAGNFVASDEYFLEDVTDGMYAYNSCRTPWRISMDYLVNGNQNAKNFSDKLNKWITTKTNNAPENILAGYELDGTDYADYDDLCFTAPFLISAMTDADFSEWENSLWTYISSYGDDVYYGDTIKMLCMITYSDLWKVPTESPVYEKGDINADGNVGSVDLVMLSRYLTGSLSMASDEGERADMDSDSTIDIFDLMLLRQKIAEDK